MANPLQKSPLGLLGALDLKVLGRNPDAVPLFLQLAYDAQPFYSAGNLRAVAASQTLGGGGRAELTVPSGFAWRVVALGGSVSATGGAITGDKLIFGLRVRSAPAAGGFEVNVGSAMLPAFGTDVLDAGERFSFGGFLPVPFVLPPSGSLSVFWESINAGSPSSAAFNVTALIEEFPV